MLEEENCVLNKQCKIQAEVNGQILIAHFIGQQNHGLYFTNSTISI